MIDKIFNRFFRKQSEARTIATQMQLGLAAPSPANYDTYSKEGYEKVVMAYRCINMIADAVAGIEWELYSKSTNGERSEVSEHPLLKLMDKPNPLMARSQFMKAITSYYLIAGNSYIEANKPTPNKPPRELWPVQTPNNMKVIVGNDGYPQAYQYTSNGVNKRWPVDFVNLQSDILHLKTFNATNLWYGLSPLQVGIQAIDQNNAASIWNLSLLKNMATPSGVLTVKTTDANPTGSLTDKQREDLKADMQERYSGSRNAGRPMLLEGNLAWQSISLSPKDMDFLKQKDVTANDICLIYGVPGELVGLGQKTFNNYAEARAAFYTETILPFMDFLATEFNGWLVPAFGDNLELDYDKDDIEALVYIRQTKMKALESVNYLTVNEKRKASGYEEADGWDVFVINNQIGALPVDFQGGAMPTDPNASTDPNDPGDPNEGNETDEPNGDDTNDVNGGGKKPVNAETSDEEDGEDPTEKYDHRSPIAWKSFNLLNRYEKTQTWRAQNSRRKYHQVGFQRDLKHEFDKLAKNMKAAIHAHNNIHTIQNVLIKELDKVRPEIAHTIQKNIRLTAEDFGGNLLAEAKSINLMTVETKSMKHFQSFVDSYTKTRTSQAMTQIESTSVKKVHEISRRLISQAIEDGDTNYELADKFVDEFSSLSDSRAMTIARTEVAIASNTATREAVRSLDVPNIEKEWVTANDDRVRDGAKGDADHSIMNGASVPLDENFDVPPDASMDGPCDESADAGQIINCRCVLTYSQRGNNNGINDGEE